MNKTLFALMISASLISVPTLAASVDADISGQAIGSADSRLQETETTGEMTAQGSNRTRVEADQQALGQARDNTENSAQQVVVLGGTVAGEARQSGDTIAENASADGSVDVSQASHLVVETADGVAIDLNSNTAVEAAASATTNTLNLVDESQRFSGSVVTAARASGAAVIENTRDTVGALQGAISVTSETTTELSGSITSTLVQDVQASVEETRETLSEAADVGADVQSSLSSTLEGSVSGGLL